MEYQIGWLILAIVLFIVEGVTYGLVSIWFAIGAVAAMIAAFFGLGFIWQLVIFTVVSALTLALTRKFFKQYLIKKTTPTNADRIIGATGVVMEEIYNQNAKGQIKVAGQTWTARSNDNSVIGEGESVKVLEIQGVKAIVEKQIVS